MSGDLYEMVSVSGGKFHRLADPLVDEVSAFRPSLTACGRMVSPSNYFDTEADALAYCGDRSEYLCSQCAPASESWWWVEVSPNGVEHTLVRGRCVTCGRSHDDWPGPMSAVHVIARRDGSAEGWTTACTCGWSITRPTSKGANLALSKHLRGEAKAARSA